MSTASRLRPVVALAGVTSYQPPQPHGRIDLKLDANEGPAPPPEFFALLRDVGVWEVRNYPRAAALEAALAQRHDLPAERVLVTAGGDDALDRICRVMLEPGRVAVTTLPTFEMIARYIRLRGAAHVPIRWMHERFPVAELIAQLSPQTAAVFAVTPNNPTGAVCNAEELAALSAALERQAPGAVLIVDLAYTEFADVDLTPVALTLPNAVVIRTFSKALGLAGLRVGYALGPAELIGWMRAAGNPYAVAGPSLLLARAWLERGQTWLCERVARIRAERAALAALLSELGGRPGPSQANFVLAQIAQPVAVCRQLAEQGIAIRRFDEPELLRSFVRISCPGEPAAFERLCAALRSALPQRTIALHEVDLAEEARQA